MNLRVYVDGCWSVTQRSSVENAHSVSCSGSIHIFTTHFNTNSFKEIGQFELKLASDLNK